MVLTERSHSLAKRLRLERLDQLLSAGGCDKLEPRVNLLVKICRGICRCCLRCHYFIQYFYAFIHICVYANEIAVQATTSVFHLTTRSFSLNYRSDLNQIWRDESYELGTNLISKFLSVWLQESLILSLQCPWVRFLPSTFLSFLLIESSFFGNSLTIT